MQKLPGLRGTMSAAPVTRPTPRSTPARTPARTPPPKAVRSRPHPKPVHKPELRAGRPSAFATTDALPVVNRADVHRVGPGAYRIREGGWLHVRAVSKQERATKGAKGRRR